MKNENAAAIQTSHKKRNALIALLIVVAVAIGGTMAWLTRTSTLTNTFTVGDINPVDPDKPGPGGGDIPGEDKKNEKKLKDNLYEPGWVPDSKLVPSGNVTKDPYVGVGKGSEAAYVYVYVTSTFSNPSKVTFTLNDGWEPVTAVTAKNNNKTYSSGLFKYTAGLDGSKAEANVWTTAPVFNKVTVSADATKADLMTTPSSSGSESTTVGSIKVQSFLHQEKDAEGKTISEDTVIPAAKKALGIN